MTLVATLHESKEHARRATQKLFISSLPAHHDILDGDLLCESVSSPALMPEPSASLHAKEWGKACFSAACAGRESRTTVTSCRRRNAQRSRHLTTNTIGVKGVVGLSLIHESIYSDQPERAKSRADQAGRRYRPVVSRPAKAGRMQHSHLRLNISTNYDPVGVAQSVGQP